MKKIIWITVFIGMLLTGSAYEAAAQQTKDWGGVEVEAIVGYGFGNYSPGMNGRVSVGYVFPKKFSALYLDWGADNTASFKNATHSLHLSYGIPFHTGERFSIVPKLGVGTVSFVNSEMVRKWHLSGFMSMTLRYYITEDLWCGFEARMESYKTDNKFIGNSNSGLTAGITLGIRF